MAASGTGFDLRWRPFRLRMKRRFEAASGPIGARDGVVVEISDGSVRGIGEASPLPSLGGGTVEDVCALLARDGSRLLDALSRDPDHLFPSEPGAMALRCALDTALLDAEARRRGIPVAAMLADTWDASVPVNALIGDGPPAEVASFGEQAVAAGYRVLKVKVGVRSPAQDIERVVALAASCPEAEIRLDANGAWSEQSARQALLSLANVVSLVEQPVAAAAVAAMGRLRALDLTPIGADESLTDADVREDVFRSRACDVAVLKPMVLGGLRPAVAIAARARALGIDVLATTTHDASVGISAALHLAAALPGTLAHGLGTGDHLEDDLVAAPLRPSVGELHVPEGPGLGVELDEDELDRSATADWREASV